MEDRGPERLCQAEKIIMDKNKEYIKTTIRIPKETWNAIRQLQKKRQVRSIQHAVELGLQWVVATAKKRQENKLNDTNNGDK
jgi:hypothetical protein